MKYNATKKISLILAIISTGVFLHSNLGQEVSKTELEARALQYFDANKYDKAATDFKVLNNMFPRDSRFAYYLGRSYFHSNQKLTEATELLRFAATRNYGNDTYYYLGRAHHLNYKFEDATLAFLTFQQTARNSDLNRCNIDYWIRVNENAKESVKLAQQIIIEKEKSVPEGALESAFDEELNGNFIYIPNAFRSAKDIELNYQSLIFLPINKEVGDYLYFESHSKKEKKGLDLYRVQVLSAENFSLPEPLPDIINTEYDEAYPYFDKTTSTLYFSSKGHNTSGGYDIFKCSFDSEKSIWTSVEKLNFPINTPSDEILYTNLADAKKSIFLSRRNAEWDEYVAYTMANDRQSEYESLMNRDELMACASFTYEIESDSADAFYQNYEQKSGTEEHLSGVDDNNKEDSEYGQLLTEALIFQAQSDSLGWIVKDLRAKIKEEEDYQKKQTLIANITTFDKESKRLQAMADEKFLLAEQGLDPVEVEIRQTDDSNIQAENNLNGITVYSYTASSNQDEISSVSDDEEEYIRGKEAAKSVQSGFSIRQTSPYSASNPIPGVSIQAGLIYKIQLGSFSQAIPENTFQGLTPVSKEKDKGITKYYVGNFVSLKEVRKALEKVKNYGYPDAFIVSFNDNDKINIQKAKEIEFAKK